MKKVILFRSIVFTVLLTLPSFASTQNIPHLTPTFPNLTGENLNGKKFKLPADLPADRTLFLIAFEREQQATLDTWVRGLDLVNSQIPWIEVPIISTPYILGSFIIDLGMRKSISNSRIRDKVITLYTDREAFATSMGFEYDKQGAYVAVIDRSGKNLGMVKGDYSESKAKELLSLLGLK